LKSFHNYLCRQLKGGGMKINMKKIISLLLSFVMIFTMSIPTFAASNEVTENENQEKTVVQLSDGNYMEITSEINNSTRASGDRGSFFIKEFVNDELIHTVEGTYGGSQLICTDYENGQEVNQKIINIADRVSVSKSSSGQPAAAASYGSAIGKIVYNKDKGSS